MDAKSIMGYANNSPYSNAPYLDIETPEGLITMENTPIDLLGIDNLGNTKKMKAGQRNPYKFEGNVVREIPLNPYQEGGINQELLAYLFNDDEDEVMSTPEVVEANEDDKDLSLAKTERLIRQREQDELAMSQTDYSQNPYRRTAMDDDFGFDDELPDVQYSTPSTYSGQLRKGFQSFATPEEGWNALRNQLNLYKTGKTRNPVGPNSTLLEAMSVYAPAADRNNPVAYANRIASNLGISVNTRIANIDTERWAREIAKVEGNKVGNNPGNLRPYKR